MSQTFPDVAILYKPVKPGKLTFQFSIRGLLMAASIAVLIVWAIAVPALFAIVAGAAMVAITAMLFTTVVMGRGWIRAFAIGCLIPNLLGYLVLVHGIGRPEGLILLFLISGLAGLGVGCVAALTHGFLKRRGGKIAIPDLPWIRDWLSNE